MGSVKGISYDEFPQQGIYKGRRTEVVFHYDLSRRLTGTIVRDDREDPWVTIIALDDGRHVLATECQYSPILEGDERGADDPGA